MKWRTKDICKIFQDKDSMTSRQRYTFSSAPIREKKISPSCESRWSPEMSENTLTICKKKKWCVEEELF